jgi:hypothetical protein
MTIVSNLGEIEDYQARIGEMTEDRIQFRTNWLRQRGWCVVPVEDGMHFSASDSERIVLALQQAGYDQCIAIATEPLDPLPQCYRMSITVEDFAEFNQTCGLFWFLITDEDRSWAISCNNSYDLFAGDSKLVEAMMGKAIPAAREEFEKFSRQLAHGDPDYLPLRVAQHYAEL